MYVHLASASARPLAGRTSNASSSSTVLPTNHNVLIGTAWDCNQSSDAWSVWSTVCSRVAPSVRSARSSSVAGWSARWTTTGPSTSRAGASCPTTSRSCSARRIATASATSRTRSRTELVEAAREYAREEGYHFMGPVAVDAAGRRQAEARPLQRASPAPPGRRRARRGVARAAVRRSGSAATRPRHRRPPAGLHDLAQRPATSAAATPRSAAGRRATSSSTSDSTNGTMVNGMRIIGEQRLNDGDIISFGSTHVRFEAS